MRLPASDARVMEFDYTACDFIGGDKARFKYRLEGFDKDWVDAGIWRRASYTNLRPGNYRFHVIACNHNGVWNETGASVAFYVAPHYSETWWFQSTVWLSLVAVLGVDASAFTLEITDNGRSFDLAQGFVQSPADGREHNGLVNIRDRLTEIGASFQFASQPNRGNRVHISVPKS